MYASISKAGKRLYDFHVADNNRMAPGQGALDWKKIVKTLHDTGYDGAAHRRVRRSGRPHAGQQYPNAVEKNPVNISPEQLKFIQDHGSSLLARGVLQHAGREIGRNNPAADQVAGMRGCASAASPISTRLARAIHAHHACRSDLGADPDRGRAPAPSDFGQIKTFDSCPRTHRNRQGHHRLGRRQERRRQLRRLCRHRRDSSTQELAPRLIGRDPRDISVIWDSLYNGVRYHHAVARGHVMPDLSRRGLTIAAISAHRHCAVGHSREIT